MARPVILLSFALGDHEMRVRVAKSCVGQWQWVSSVAGLVVLGLVLGVAWTQRLTEEERQLVGEWYDAYAETPPVQLDLRHFDGNVQMHVRRLSLDADRRYRVTGAGSADQGKWSSDGTYVYLEGRARLTALEAAQRVVASVMHAAKIGPAPAKDPVSRYALKRGTDGSVESFTYSPARRRGSFHYPVAVDVGVFHPTLAAARTSAGVEVAKLRLIWRHAEKLVDE